MALVPNIFKASGACAAITHPSYISSVPSIAVTRHPENTISTEKEKLDHHRVLQKRSYPIFQPHLRNKIETTP